VEQEVDNNLESNLATIILARAMVTSNIVNNVIQAQYQNNRCSLKKYIKFT